MRKQQNPVSPLGTFECEYRLAIYLEKKSDDDVDKVYTLLRPHVDDYRSSTLDDAEHGGLRVSIDVYADHTVRVEVYQIDPRAANDPSDIVKTFSNICTTEGYDVRCCQLLMYVSSDRDYKLDRHVVVEQVTRGYYINNSTAAELLTTMSAGDELENVLLKHRVQNLRRHHLHYWMRLDRFLEHHPIYQRAKLDGLIGHLQRFFETDDITILAVSNACIELMVDNDPLIIDTILGEIKYRNTYADYYPTRYNRRTDMFGVSNPTVDVPVHAKRLSDKHLDNIPDPEYAYFPIAWEFAGRYKRVYDEYVKVYGRQTLDEEYEPSIPDAYVVANMFKVIPYNPEHTRRDLDGYC